MMRPRDVSFLLIDQFSLTGFSATLDALRQANRLAGCELYAWRTCGVAPGPVQSSAGLSIETTCVLEDIDSTDLLLVMSSSSTTLVDESRIHKLLRHHARCGSVIGGLSLGSYILARAGLLEGRRCTVHWENLEAFREAFPTLNVTGDLFEMDQDRYTCAGGAAGMDMMLHYIAEDHGLRFASKVADVFMHPRIRDRDEQQRMPLRARIGVSHPRLLRYIELIENSDEAGLCHHDLAKQVGLSSRQLERLFQKYLRTTPSRYYMQHRMRRARTLLRDTSLSIIDVAVACGFSSHSHFTKSYREHFGQTPRDERISQAGGMDL